MVHRIRKLYNLSEIDQHLLIVSFILAGAIRIGLWLLPFRVIRDIASQWSQSVAVPYETDRAIIDKITWSVSVVSRYIPAATCLVQAMTTQVLLDRRGIRHELRIGVARTENGYLEAHAWIEYRDEVIIGSLDDLSRFTILPSLAQIKL